MAPPSPKAGEPEAQRERRKLRGRLNQMERAAAGVTLAVDGLAPKDQCIILQAALRTALADWRAAEAEARGATPR